MKKTVLASALVLAMGVTSVAEANTAGLTGVWSGTYTFTMFSGNGGLVGSSGPGQSWGWDFDAGSVTIANTTAFFGSVWTAHDTTFADNGTDYGANPAGSVNMLFDWSVNTNIPVSINWDVAAAGNAVSDSATVTTLNSVITPNSPAFPGFQPFFDGNLHKVSGGGVPQIPVPAAVWLMGSGLLGLVGVARRRRRS